MKALVRILAGRNFSLSFSQRKGDRCMKNTDHRISHPCVHLDDLASLLTRRGYVWRDGQFGRGQNIGLGWSDPTFGHLLVAKRYWGRSSPQRNFVRCLARVPRQILCVSPEGRR